MIQLRISSLLVTLLIPILSCLARPLESANTEPGVLRIPIRKSNVRDTKNLPHRDLPLSLDNTVTRYLLDASIGTPPQPVQFDIDTGSSETWVITPDACNGCSVQTYDPALSGTAMGITDLGQFVEAYADGTSATGYYVSDTMILDNVLLQDVNFGVATSISSGYQIGIMGLGFDSAQTSVIGHPSVLDSLYSARVISSHSYSIYLDDRESQTGSILFGGIDSTKYTGDLVSLSIIPTAEGDYGDALNVPWTSLLITNGTGYYAQLTASDLSFPTLLDTGATLTHMPEAIFNSLAAYFGATAPDDNGVSYVSCDMPDGYLTFGFGDGPAVTIDVPFSELAVPAGGDMCWFGLTPQSGSALSFGDTFLRSAYYNVNFDTSEISLAQSAW